MARETKLTKEKMALLKQLSSEGYNHTEIAEKMGSQRQTIDYWVKKFNIKTIKRIGKQSLEKRKIFENELKKTGSPNKAAKKAGFKSNCNFLVKEKGLQELVNKKSFPKISFKEIQNRLPENERKTSKVIGFENGKYKIQTKDGYIYYKSSAKIKQGDPRGKNGTSKAVEHIKKELEKLDYEYIEGYTGRIRDNLTAKHLKCGKLRVNRLKNFELQDCAFCSNNGVSNAELELLDWVRQWYPEAHSTRKIIHPKELDIYIPSLNLAIEYCGLYWHNESKISDKKYHYKKMKACNEKGVRLITVFEDEWLNRNEQVKNFLKSSLGVIEKRVYARKCELKEVEKKVAKDFLGKTHIQGKTPIKVAFGLYYKNELLGLITGNTHHRQKNKKTAPFVLNRLSFKDGVQVVGGASRLLKKLIFYAKNMGYEKIISWSDNRISEGNVYLKCGFTLEENLGPDYSYVTESGKRESKQSNKKSNLLKKGAKGSMHNTEKELAISIGHNRIWDCGKKRWVYCLS